MCEREGGEVVRCCIYVGLHTSVISIRSVHTHRPVDIGDRAGVFSRFVAIKNWTIFGIRGHNRVTITLCNKMRIKDKIKLLLFCKRRHVV